MSPWNRKRKLVLSRRGARAGPVAAAGAAHNTTKLPRRRRSDRLSSLPWEKEEAGPSDKEAPLAVEIRFEPDTAHRRRAICRDWHAHQSRASFSRKLPSGWSQLGRWQLGRPSSRWRCGLRDWTGARHAIGGFHFLAAVVVYSAKGRLKFDQKRASAAQNLNIICEAAVLVGLQQSSAVGLNLFLYHYSSTCALFQAPPGYKYVVKPNVLFGKFIDQISSVVKRLRARAPLEIYWRPSG